MSTSHHHDGGSGATRGLAGTGKKLVPNVAKNMPSAMTVLGAIDESYRPALAAEVAAVMAAHQPELVSQGSRVSPGPMSIGSYANRVLAKVTRECPANVKLQHPTREQEYLDCPLPAPSTGNTLLDRLSVEERMLIASKVDQLAARLRHHDALISLRSGEIQDLVAIRDLRIAQKKSTVTKLKGHVTLNRQKEVTRKILAAGASDDVLNANYMTRHRPTPVEAPSRLSSSFSPPPLTSPATDQSLLADRWKNATHLAADELARRAKVQPLQAKRLEGRKAFAAQSESPFCIDVTLLTATRDRLATVPLGEERVKHFDDLHRGRKLVRTTPEQWMLREADRLKTDFTAGVVFTNPEAALQALDVKLRATSSMAQLPPVSHLS